MTIEYRISPPLANETLNALFSVGWPSWQKAPDTSDWQPVLKRSLVYIAAFDAERLIGFVNVAGDGRDHAFILDTRVDPDFRMRGSDRNSSRGPRTKRVDLGANGYTLTTHPNSRGSTRHAVSARPRPAYFA